MKKKHNNIIPFSNYWTKKSKPPVKKSDSSLFNSSFTSSEDEEHPFEPEGQEAYDEQAKIYYMSNYLQAKAQPPLQEPFISQDSEQLIPPVEIRGGGEKPVENNIISFQKKLEDKKSLLSDSDTEDYTSKGGERTFQNFSGDGSSSAPSKKFRQKGNVIYVNFKESRKPIQKPWAMAKAQAMALSAAAFFAFLFVFQTADGLRSGKNLASSMIHSLKSGSYAFLPDKRPIPPSSLRGIANTPATRKNPLSPAQRFRQTLKKQGGEGLSNGSAPLSSEYKGF